MEGGANRTRVVQGERRLDLPLLPLKVRKEAETTKHWVELAIGN